MLIWLQCLKLKIIYWWRNPKRVLAHYLPDIKEACETCGYAIAVHGSLKRDIDLVAVPWSDFATSAEVLIYWIEKYTGLFYIDDGTNPTIKPHGRKAWTLHQHGFRTYFDISVAGRVGTDA